MSLPNRAYLADMERFTRSWATTDDSNFTLDLQNPFFSVHPLVICLIAAMSDRALRDGGYVALTNEANTPSVRYLQRMKLFEHMGTGSSVAVNEYEPAGRFIPLTAVHNGDDLSKFLTDFVPLLHAGPQESMTVRYVLAELVRNTLEHSTAGVAYVAAQVTRAGRLLVGVADAGVGIRSTIGRFHHAETDAAAIVRAFEPGISGATPNFGGNENNGGAGLFFMKAMAVTAQCHMVAISGDSLMKLLKQPGQRINARLTEDRVTWRELTAPYPGTAVGIDILINESIQFQDLLAQIRQVYYLQLRSEKPKRKARISRGPAR